MLADVVAIIGETILFNLWSVKNCIIASGQCRFDGGIFILTGTQDIVFGEVDRWNFEEVGSTNVDGFPFLLYLSVCLSVSGSVIRSLQHQWCPDRQLHS